MTHSRQVTKRFLIAFDRITADRSEGKITQKSLGEKLGISSSNINRLRSSQDHNVTLEACCRICEQYGISPAWLLLGKEETGNLEGRLTATEEELREIREKLVQLNRKLNQITG